MAFLPWSDLLMISAGTTFCTMTSVEAFMQEFFAARNEFVRQGLANRVPLRNRFLHADCSFWSEAHAAAEIANYQAESVLSVTTEGERAEVLTTGYYGGHFRGRYQLQRSGEGWLIRFVQFECSICRGTGKRKDAVSDCPLCKGKGWHTCGESAS